MSLMAFLLLLPALSLFLPFLGSATIDRSSLHPLDRVTRSTSPCFPLFCEDESSIYPRPHSVSITEFGAVGDGTTLNTHAFQNAIFYLHSFADKGGAQLYVPAGKWLTGSFNLTSHLTLFLDKDAIILGSQDPKSWPIIDPLPSYGRGRELPGGRHMSLIYGRNLTDVVITGDNGTIDGQSGVWWEMYFNRSLDYTRGSLVEMIDSTDVVISNLTFKNSPYWNIHPVYCRNVLIQNLTILAPQDSPNTDGVVTDSSSDVCIKDCIIHVGGDLMSIKSGWDEYGISYGCPSSNILIQNISGSTGMGAGIALGSEMSGGVSDIYVIDMDIAYADIGIFLKTTKGRGGYIQDVHMSGISISNARVAVGFTSSYGDHPDCYYDPDALPDVKAITIENVVAFQVNQAGFFEGLKEMPFREIYLANVSVDVTSLDLMWNCSFVQGYSESVYPELCSELQDQPVSISQSLSSGRDVI